MANIDGPTELEFAMFDRYSTCGFAEIGPLTKVQQESYDAYIAWCEETEAEHDAWQRAGERSVCPRCSKRSVKETVVATLGGGLPGSEYSVMRECERCDYRSL